MSDGGRWVDEPPLPVLPPPGPDVPLVYGARLIRVHRLVQVAGAPQRRGHTELVAVARAPLKDGTVGALCAWLGHWQQGGRTTGRARWEWLQVPDDPLLVEEMPRPPAGSLIECAAWHGHHTRSEFARAVRGAVAQLPHDKRAAALKPLPDPEQPAVDDPATPGDLP